MRLDRRLGGLDGQIVHHLDGRRNNARGDDAAHRGANCLGAGIDDQVGAKLGIGTQVFLRGAVHDKGHTSLVSNPQAGLESERCLVASVV